MNSTNTKLSARQACFHSRLHVSLSTSMRLKLRVEVMDAEDRETSENGRRIAPWGCSVGEHKIMCQRLSGKSWIKSQWERVANKVQTANVSDILIYLLPSPSQQLFAPQMCFPISNCSHCFLHLECPSSNLYCSRHVCPSRPSSGTNSTKLLLSTLQEVISPSSELPQHVLSNSSP